jgi:hypothetical protein|mmetsp:Transcript_15956/g.36245  ORF Transcript_15956/g.36245 Transcript_15956/m.36245 type:complete len:84 (+) Transcript_15956:3-254(+)
MRPGHKDVPRARRAPCNRRANAKSMEPASWWGMYCKHLPILCSIAVTVLGQAGAASAAERNWSVYGQIQTHGAQDRGQACVLP